MNELTKIPDTPLLVLVGPTGSGKTAIAIELCRLLNGEIISADSMQIYRRCDIVTAKPSAEEQAQARHHLIDICEPTYRFSAAQWAEEARAAIEDIRSRGKQPIIAGGTGFYIRALLQPETLTEVAPNPALRKELEQELASQGHEPMWQKLHEIKPDIAAKIHPNDHYRVLRALEIALSAGLGMPDSEGLQSGVLLTEAQASGYDFLAFGLEMPREELYARIEKRVEAMIAAGAWEELRILLESGVPRDAPALGGVGYKQMLPALDDVSQRVGSVEVWKRDTRRYAKRQLTWFRHQLPVQWVNINQSSQPVTVAEFIKAQWQQGLTDYKIVWKSNS